LLRLYHRLDSGRPAGQNPDQNRRQWAVLVCYPERVMRRTAATFALAVASLVFTAPGAVAAASRPASTPKDGAVKPLIAVIAETGKSSELMVKQGSLSAKWVAEYKPADSHSASIATDTKHGPLIALVTDNFDVLVKEGSLTAKWTRV
jgi:hypothetical protein